MYNTEIIKISTIDHEYPPSSHFPLLLQLQRYRSNHFSNELEHASAMKLAQFGWSGGLTLTDWSCLHTGGTLSSLLLWQKLLLLSQSQYDTTRHDTIRYDTIHTMQTTKSPCLLIKSFHYTTLHHSKDVEIGDQWSVKKRRERSTHTHTSIYFFISLARFLFHLISFCSWRIDARWMRGWVEFWRMEKKFCFFCFFFLIACLLDCLLVSSYWLLVWLGRCEGISVVFLRYGIGMGVG